MARTISVTEARDNFPALVRRVSASKEALIVTSRNQPRVVIVDYETFQRQRELQEEGARSLLKRRVEETLSSIESTREAPDSTALYLLSGTLEQYTREMWLAGRAISRPVRSLATTLHNAIANLREGGDQLTLEQLDRLVEVVPLLLEPNLTIEKVAEADRQLLAVGLDAVFPIEGDLVSLYESSPEDEP
jgi:prevent-host-death family protein